MLLDVLRARATAMPGFEFWRNLAPRRFLLDVLLADFIRATEVLPADNANGLFALITTSPLGLPKTLPAGWREVDSIGEYFATYRVPATTTANEVLEALALELVPLFYPPERYRDQLTTWLIEEIGEDVDTTAPTRVVDIPSPHNYRNPRSEAEEDLDFLYGNGRTPPGYHGYKCKSKAQPVSFYGPPEVSDVAIQESEDAAFYFG